MGALQQLLASTKPASAGMDVTSLISYWKLDEASGNALDAAGSNTLTSVNGVGTNTGKINGAREFITNQYLNIASNASLVTGDIDFTITGWVRLATLVQGGIVSKWQFGTGLAYTVAYHAGSAALRFQVDSLGNGSGLDTAANDLGGAGIAANTWYFFVGWHDATANTVNISVNDNTVVSVAHAGGAFVGTSPFRIGENGSNGPMDNARIDEVSLWKRVLTPTERTWLYNSGNGRSYSEITG